MKRVELLKHCGKRVSIVARGGERDKEVSKGEWERELNQKRTGKTLVCVRVR